jgi:hypothetical protein
VTAAYNSGSTMARTLQSLEPGTSVYAGTTRVGEVRAVYAEGQARMVELVIVRWDARDEDVMVPVSEIEAIDDAGVQLIHKDPDQYVDLAPFDPAGFPTMKKLA